MQHRSFAIDDRRPLVIALCCGTIAAALLYVFLLAATFSHIAAARANATELTDLRAKTSLLEERYLSLAARISPSLMALHGLATPLRVHYVTRKPLGLFALRSITE